MRRRGSSVDGKKLPVPASGSSTPGHRPGWPTDAAGAVALGHPSGAALITPHGDHLSGLELNQLLEHQLLRLANQPSAAAGAEAPPQLRRGSIRVGRRFVLLDD